MNKILVIAEHDGKKLNPATARAVSCALAIGGEIDIAVFAGDAAAVAGSAAKLKGVKRILKVERAENAHQLAAVLA
ncbi:MAG TPA: electron transfer flavoprotein subunit alpha/FixB family protein, partial [Gammaproteobacteria bacterium]|nr:electron transfer flavoprotein subunit alpha/FixB family protein [Gammaproteobacteria bacterium]